MDVEILDKPTRRKTRSKSDLIFFCSQKTNSSPNFSV